MVLSSGCSPTLPSFGEPVAFLQLLWRPDADYIRSAPFPGFQRMNFPAALAALAGGALQPAFRTAIDIAGQEIPAGSPVLGRIGLRQRRHRAPRPGLGVFPGLA